MLVIFSSILSLRMTWVSVGLPAAELFPPVPCPGVLVLLPPGPVSGNIWVMLEVLGVWTKLVSTKLLSLWNGCWMLLTALLVASLFLLIWVKLGCLPLPGSGSLDLGVASLEPASSWTELRSGEA